MDELSDAYRALGEREARAPRPLWRRWLDRRRRAVGIGVIAVALVGTAAGATQLISEGEPERASRPDAARYQPGSHKPVVVMTAADSAVGLPWGVAIFDSRSGASCVFPGQVRGNTIGVVRDGTFRPFAGPTSAACSHLKAGEVVLSVKTFPTTPRRVLGVGRAGPGVAKVRLTAGSVRRVAAVGPGRAFLFVLDYSDAARYPGIEPLDAQGRAALGPP
jgi:hypothetical protein